MTELAFMLEAERRGLLPDNKKQLLDEARARGLAPSNIDFNRPVKTVRDDVGKLTGKQRERALNDWADAFVAKERETGGVGMAADNTARTLARGSFVGPFLDEATAAVQGGLHAVTGGHMGAPYDESLAYQRARDRAVDRDYPVLSLTGQLAGGLVSGGAALRSGGAGGAVVGGPVAAIAPVATVPGRVAQGAVAGAAYGGVGGFGHAEGGFGNRMEGAAGGAAIGTALGGVLSGASEGVSAVRQAAARQGQTGAHEAFRHALGDTSLDDFADMVATGASGRNQDVQRRALDVVGEEMQRHGGDHLAARQAALQRIQAEFGVQPSTAATNIRNLTAAHRDSPLTMGEYPAVAESNRATRLMRPENIDTAEASQITNAGTHDLVDYLGNQGGRADATIRNAVQDRNAGLSDWMRERFQAMAPGGQTLDDAERMIEGVGRQAHQEYRAAYAGPINQRGLDAVPLLVDRHARRAAGRAGEQRDAIQRALREFEAPENGQLSLQQLQDARQSVRGMMTRAERAGENHIVGALQPLYRDVSRLMSLTSPDWARANARWAGMSRFGDALDMGQRMAGKPGIVQREALAEFDRLAPEAQDMVRVGWLQQQFDKLTELRDTHDVSKLFDKQSFFNVARRMFGDRAAVDLARSVRDAEVANKSARMLANSQTHRRGQVARVMDADLGIVAAAENASVGGVRRWMTERLIGLFRDRRNVPLAEMVSTPMSDVFSVARNIHNMRASQQRMERLSRPSIAPSVRAGLVSEQAGAAASPRRR